MGDWLRRLLYPLVLPAIVGTVWVCGWVRQQDDRANRSLWRYQTVTITAPAPAADPDRAILPAPPNSRRVRSEFFAATDVEDAADGR